MFGRMFGAGELCAVACAATWAVALILFRGCGRTVPPMALNLFKDCVGLVLFLVTLPLLGVPFFPPETTATDCLTLLVSGALGIGIADTLFFICLNRLGATGAAIIDCMYSPFLLVCAFFYLHEPVGPALLLGMVLMGGALVLGADGPLPDRSAPETRRELRSGVVYGTVGVLLMAVSIVLAKPVLLRVDVWWATAMRLVGGVVLLGVQGLMPANRAAVWRVFTPSREWRLTVPGGLVGAYLSMILWLAGMKFAQTAVAGLLNQLSTVFVVLLATLLLREPLRPRKALAVVLGIAAGLVVVS